MYMQQVRVGIGMLLLYKCFQLKLASFTLYIMNFNCIVEGIIFNLNLEYRYSSDYTLSCWPAVEGEVGYSELSTGPSTISILG